MSSLYDVMEVKSTCTKADLAKQFKILTYKYKIEGKKDKLVELNTAFEILNDQHKRQYYNFYGNSQIETLQKPLEGHLYSHYFTRFNMFFIILATFLALVNLSCLYYFFVFIESNIVRFSLVLISPFLIAITMVNSYRAVIAHKKILRPFITMATYVSITVTEIYLIACYYDDFIDLLPCMVSVAILEGLLTVYYYVNNRKYIREHDSSGLKFCIAKGFIVLFIFVDFHSLGMFTPTLVIFSYCISEKKIAMLFGVPVLFYNSLVYFFSDHTRWFVHPFLMIYILGAGYLMYLLLLFLKGNAPFTLRDKFVDQACLPMFNEELL